MLNPQAVATPCTPAQLSSDACPAASQVGKISIQYRIGGSLVTSTGSVYSTTPESNSAINFGFVIRPSSTYQKFYFVSGMTTGLDRNAPSFRHRLRPLALDSVLSEHGQDARPDVSR